MHRLLLTFILLCLASTTQAREAVVGMNERVLKQINEVQELIDAEDYDGALEELQGMNRRRLSSYETAHVLNIEGYIYFQQGDAVSAQQSYEGALAQERLPDSMLANLRLTLGRLGLMQENFDYAIGHLRALLTIPDQDKPSNRVLLGMPISASRIMMRLWEKSGLPWIAAAPEATNRGKTGWACWPRCTTNSRISSPCAM